MSRTTPEEISFTVPLIPPTVNMYVRHTRRGGHYVSSEAKKFKEAIMVFSRGAHLEAEAYEVNIRIYLGFRQRGDVDNFLKCTLDGLGDSQIIRTDDAVQKLTIEKFRDRQNPRTEITVRAI